MRLARYSATRAQEVALVEVICLATSASSNYTLSPLSLTAGTATVAGDTTASRQLAYAADSLEATQMEAS